MDAAALLRPGLLVGRMVAFGGGDALAPSLAALGATVHALPAHLDEEAMAAAAPADADALVHDLRPAFAAEGLQPALERAWVAIRALATAAFIPDGRGGKIVLVAPAPDDGDPASAGLRAATENLARTLSIEWARHGITTAAITPGADTDEAQLAALAAYLASPAGDYFSGARLALGEVVPA